MLMHMENWYSPAGFPCELRAEVKEEPAMEDVRPISCPINCSTLATLADYACRGQGNAGYKVDQIKRQLLVVAPKCFIY